MRSVIEKALIVALLASILFTTAACSNNVQQNEIIEKRIIMKIGHTQPITHPRHQSLLKFKEIVEAKTYKRMEVQIYPAAQLGSDDEIMKMVKDGSLQAMRGNQLEAAAPELLIYTLPFLFDNLEDAHKITRGGIGDKIARFSEKNNIIILATGDVGDLRDITNNVRPITRPEEMKGLIMRTPPIESTVKTLEAFGASTLPVSYDELYSALKAGVVDGQENPLINITALKLEEVQKYLTIIKYQYLPDPFFVNMNWYWSQEPETRKILKEAAMAMMVYSDELIKKETASSVQKLQNSMVIHTLNYEQRKRFIEQAKPVYDYYFSKGLFSKEDIEEIRNAVK